jgi:hypothetical protein
MSWDVSCLFSTIFLLLILGKVLVFFGAHCYQTRLICLLSERNTIVRINTKTSNTITVENFYKRNVNREPSYRWNGWLSVERRWDANTEVPLALSSAGRFLWQADPPWRELNAEVTAFLIQLQTNSLELSMSHLWNAKTLPINLIRRKVFWN